MPVLVAEHLSKSFPHKSLFTDIDFGIDYTDRVGLIGVNGSGKSTLIKLLAKETDPDSGRVIIEDTAVVGYLPQNPQWPAEFTVLEAIFENGSRAMQLVGHYEDACHALAEHHDDPKLISRVAELSHELDTAQAWGLETEAKVILGKLGILDTSQEVGTLSGGQKKRIALARALLIEPQLLILDEPTNHLDAETIDWLEGYLRRYTGAMLLVTHDRYFLDRVTNRIIEIDKGGLITYGGNYSYYVEKKADEEERLLSAEHKRKRLLKKELEWLKRGAKARTTKQKARIDRAEELKATPDAQKQGSVEFVLPSQRLGTQVIEFDEVSKRYDEKQLVEGFTYSIARGERIGIIGPNGSGKTTLLEMITERVKPDKGTITVGPTVRIGYYDQESRALDESQRVIDYIEEAAYNVKVTDGKVISASQLLERFLFPPQMQYAPIAKLSGGERRRLYLLRILIGAPNVLLFDEPTNDLDIQTLVALEGYLDDFPGCIIVVSHDRYFLDRTIDHVFRFEGDGRVREYPGNYSAFLEIQSAEKKEAEPKALASTANPIQQPKSAANKLSYKEKKELESLEKAIASSEERKSLLESQLSATGDYQSIQRITEELGTLSVQLDRDMGRWAELAERA